MRTLRFLHLIAHRGNASECPENTLPALQSALDLGARFIEVDVQIAANGVPVLVRDDDLTRAAGTAAHVSQLTAAELSQLDVSEPERFGARFRGTCIPRLVDAMSLVTRRRETTVFVAIGRASIARLGNDQVVSQVAEALRPFRSRCIIVSGDIATVYRARHSSGLQIGWHVASHDRHNQLKCEALQPEYVLIDHSVLPETGSLWRGPWRWVVHEISTLDAALEVASRGAQFVATAHVRSLGEAMRAHAAMRDRREEDPVATTIQGLG